MKKVYRIYQINGYSTKEIGFTASKKKAVKKSQPPVKIMAACCTSNRAIYMNIAGALSSLEKKETKQNGIRC